METGYFLQKNSTSATPRKILIFVGIIGSVAILGLLISVVNQPSAHMFPIQESQLQESEFLDFIRKYNKDYTDEEFVQRFNIFMESSAYIRNHNAQGLSWTLAVNEFADMTFEEFKNSKLMDSQPVSESKSADRKVNSFKLPPALDWRSSGAVTEVKNQGSCKAGWAFATTGAIEGLWKINGNALVSLSEQQLISCSQSYGNNGCGTGIPDFAFEYVQGVGGISSEKIYPYSSGSGTISNCVPTLASQISAKVAGYNDVTSNDPAMLLNAVTQQPIVVGVEADQYVWQYYSTGVITQNCGTNINHYALVVGYDTTQQVPYYIVKNSWGTSWGMNGYVYIAIGSDVGVCGIQIRASYPTL